MNENQRALKYESTGKLLLKFSIPAVLGMLMNSIYNIVDKLFIGNQPDIISASGDIVHVGTLSLAGLNIAFPIQMLIVALSTMIGIGASSLISRYLGAKNFDKADKTFGNAILMVIGIASMLTLVGSFFAKPILIIFGATESILPYALKYIRIIFYGTIFFSLSVSMNNIVRAEGNPFMSMIVMLSGALINIPLDYLFIYVFKWGVAGAAYATISSQLIGFIIILVYFLSGKSYFKITKIPFKADKNIMRDIFGIGLPSLVRTGAFTLFTIVVNNSIKSYGVDAHFAIMGVMFPILSLIMMPSTGITQGMQPIVGYNFGAKQIKRVRQTLNLSIVFSSLISIVGFALILSFIKPIVGAFIQETETVDMGVNILKIVLLGIPAMGFQAVIGGYFQSIGKVIPALVITSARQVIFLIPMVLILAPIYGVKGIWWSMPIADYASCALAAIWMFIEMRKEKQMLVTA